MTRDKLDRKILDALNTMYSESENVFGFKGGFTFEDINAICKSMVENGVIISEKVRVFPMFYLPLERQDEIVKNAIKGLRSFWVWPRKTEIGKDGKIVPDPEWDEYVKFKSSIDKKLNAKDITKKEYNHEIDEAAKKYGMIKRSWDAEYVAFNIWNMSPTANREMMDLSLDGKMCDKAFLDAFSDALKKIAQSE